MGVPGRVPLEELFFGYRLLAVCVFGVLWTEHLVNGGGVLVKYLVVFPWSSV